MGAEHVLQYNDAGPDWCIHCGTFAQWCAGTCEGNDGRFDGDFDNRVPANVKSVIGAVFGVEAEHA